MHCPNRSAADAVRLSCREFAAMLVFISLVSGYDGWLIVRYAQSIADMEQNPVGRLLIELDDGGVGIFLLAKAAGTIVSVGTLVLMSWRVPRLASLATSGVSLCQFALLVYLTFA